MIEKKKKKTDSENRAGGFRMSLKEEVDSEHSFCLITVQYPLLDR